MFCQYQYYRIDTEKLQTMVAHSDKNYKCKKMSDCPYTGTTLINKIKRPWVWSPEEADQEGRTDPDQKCRICFSEVFRKSAV